MSQLSVTEIRDNIVSILSNSDSDVTQDQKDYDYVVCYLQEGSDPSVAKLACQAVDKVKREKENLLFLRFEFICF